MKNNHINAEEKNGFRSLWKPIFLVVMIIAFAILARVFGIGDRIIDLKDWIKGLGFLGNFVFALIYITAVVTGIPGSAITILAGALFGSIMGVILVSISSTIGASLAFLVARYFARDAVANWLSKKEKFKKLDQLTEEHGAIIVAITRLVPLFPFNLLNYGFGLTRVKFWTYVFWSWLCMLPGTVLFILGTDAITKGISQGKIPWALIIITIVVAFILTLLVRYARRQLKAKSGETI